MLTDPQKSKRVIEDARRLEAVRAFYETGDEDLLGPLLADLRPILTAFLKSKGIHNRELRKDLVQDSVAAILLGLRKRQFEATGRVASWAMKISWVTYAAFLEGKKELPSRPGSDEDPFLLLGEKVSAPPDGLAEASEEQARAIALIKGATQVVLSLDVHARNVLLSYFYHGQDRTEACASLGISAGRYVGRLRRGLGALREWGATQQAPAAELYAALARIDTGNLFKERPHQHLTWRQKKAAKENHKS